MFNIAWTHIRRSPYYSLTAVLVLTLIFFVVSRVILILIASELTLKTFESKPQITLFLKDTTKEDEAKKIVKDVKDDPRIKNVKYVSKEEALRIYRNQNKKDPLLLEMVTASILPASIEISTIKIEDLQYFSEHFRNDSRIEEISFQKDIVQNLAQFVSLVRRVAFEYIGIHMLLSFLVIVVIVSIKISIRKDEIEILKLIGAKNSYIRLPFILEGMFYGFVGSSLAALISVFLLILGRDSLSLMLSSLGLLTSFGILDYAIYFSSTIVLGLVLGWVSSLITTSHFLK